MLISTNTPQVSTTKGTGGDVIILEEAAYCDPGFFYETVAPLMLIGRTSLLAISTLTSEINFYTRLIKMKDPVTSEPMFSTFCVELACQTCKVCVYCRYVFVHGFHVPNSGCTG